MYAFVYLLYVCHYEYITYVKCTIISTIILLMAIIYKIITLGAVTIFMTLPVGACRHASLCRSVPRQQTKFYHEAREIFIEVCT